MKLKNIVVAMILSSISLGVSAKQINDKQNIGVKGNINYDLTDYDYSVSTEDRLAGSYLSVYNDYQFLPEYRIIMDAGISNSIDIFNDNTDLSKNEFNFNINKFFIRYQDSENIYVDVGRMYTPIGFYNEDPLSHNNIVDTDSQLLRYTDAIKFTYLNSVDNVDFKVDLFGGLRLDHESQTSGNYGINVNLGNNDYGYVNFGTYIVQLEGELSNNDGETTDEISAFNLGYMYNNHNLEAIASYDVYEDSDFLTYKKLKTKVGYNINQLKPYAFYNKNELTVDEIDLFDGNVDVKNYGAGLEVYFNKNVSIDGNVSKLDYGSSNETAYQINFSFEY